MAEIVPPDGKEPPPRFRRRHVLACAGCAALGFASGWLLRNFAWSPLEAESTPENARQAIERLREGNQRFVAGRVRHSHENRTWRDALVVDQHPFAVILGCSDSRVPIELIFDQGFGDLFTVRVAGNVVATDVVGSIGYAIAHLHTPLLVILGHERCGAVTAALNADRQSHTESKNIEALLAMIGPGLRDLPPHLEGAARVSAAVEANVRWSMRQLLAIPTGRRIVESGQLTVVGAVYDLATGQVRFLEDPPSS